MLIKNANSQTQLHANGIGGWGPGIRNLSKSLDDFDLHSDWGIYPVYTGEGTWVSQSDGPQLRAQVHNAKPLALLLGMQKDSTTWRSSLTVSYKIKHALTLPPSDSTPSDLPKRNKNVFTRRLVHECSEQLYS